MLNIGGPNDSEWEDVTCVGGFCLKSSSTSILWASGLSAIVTTFWAFVFVVCTLVNEVSCLSEEPEAARARSFCGASSSYRKRTCSCRTTMQFKYFLQLTSNTRLLTAFNLATAAVAALVLFGASFLLPGVLRSS